MLPLSTTNAAAPPHQSGVYCAAGLPAMTQHVADTAGIAMDLLGLPFDVARAQYARAVQVGLIERSMLASRDFSRVLGALEQLALGPWARRV